MLDKLVEYADSYIGVTNPGFRPKEVKWALQFSTNGDFQNVLELGNTSDKKNRGKLFPKCPDFSPAEIVSWGYRHFLVDTAEVVACYTKAEKKELEKIVAKHKTFTKLISLAREAMPILGVVLNALNDKNVLEDICAKLKDKKVKPTDNVTFRIGEEFPLESSDWHQWWESFRAAQSVSNRNKDTIVPNSKKKKRCFISGNIIEPVSTHPKVSGLSDVGGLSSGTTLVGFDKEAFCSYGFDQGENAPISESSAVKYRAALDDLIKKHSATFINTKVVHWYKYMLPENSEDPLDILVSGDIEGSTLQALQQMKKMLDSIKNGEIVNLGNNQYYCLALSATGGRIMIRSWIEGKIESLTQNIYSWFEDMAIVNRNGGNALAPAPKFYAVLGSLVRDIKDVPPPLVVALWRSAITGCQLPRPVIGMALSRIRTALSKDEPVLHAGIGVLKAYLLRHYRSEEGGNEMAENIKKFVNPEHPSPAYQCGRLMAYFASLQYRALGDVGAGVVQKYYASASVTPALVIGRLTTLSQFHISKLKNNGGFWYEQRISEIFTRMGDSIPVTLTLEEQSLFALGYYQQMAELRTRKEVGEQEPIEQESIIEATV
ncbi:MAG: type I-C CRISPR-associated protein Cas8c/Csd1 [Synergistaceae bacterium]|nr:type I-C CRISPR-associated protein Cas8c/Csd1 [Synergistaceae bacterium]